MLADIFSLRYYYWPNIINYCLSLYEFFFNFTDNLTLRICTINVCGFEKHFNIRFEKKNNPMPTEEVRMNNFKFVKELIRKTQEIQGLGYI